MSSEKFSPLGKPVTYCEQYEPSLLFPIPRSEKRIELGIHDSLPFVGFDLWNAYEISWLNPRGKPVVALGRFRVPAQSPRLIESKSLKLYLNSFNQTRFESLEAVQSTIAKDLSAAAGESVNVLLELPDQAERKLGVPVGRCIDDLDIAIDRYTLDASLLTLEAGRRAEDECLYSHLLKSNCLVTGQPDWGMIAIRYSGPAIDPAALLRYIVSFRQHNEFHEQCVERIFCDIQQRCRPERLMVWARYTRRGGLDINPVRASEPRMLEGAEALSAEVRQ